LPLLPGQQTVGVGIADQGAGGHIKKTLFFGNILDVQMPGEYQMNPMFFEQLLQGLAIIQ